MFRKLLFLPMFFFMAHNASAQFSRFIVQLKNKSTNPYSISVPSAFLTARALERRARYNIPIDSTDLPITPRYIDSIRLAGNVTIINTSRWLNQVCIQSVDANALNKIAAFPFVRTISGVAARTTVDSITVDKFLLEESSLGSTGNDAPQNDLANVYSYGQSYNQIHLHQGEFLHNYGFSGQGMQMAILDAGFRNYETLVTFDSVRNNGQLLGNWSFVNNAPLPASSTAVHPHGTQCFSTIAANIPGSFVGTSPKTSFYLYQTEDPATEYPVEEQNLAAGLERADSLGVDIASISLGYTTFTNSSLNHTYSDMNGNITIAARAADFAAHKGMLLVVANGNDGTNSWKFLSTPADADSVLALGAVSTGGVVGSFSSYGPSSDGQIKPSVAAVGVNSVIADVNNGQPSTGSGTSFATPIMAGLSSCLWQAFPESNNMGIITALEESATKYTTPDDRVGYGIPDIKKAFVILLKRFYTQEIKQAGCSTLIKWTGKTGSNMNFVIERKLPADANYITLQTFSGSGSFASNSFTYWDDLSNITPPVNISYRIRMNLDTDTSFTFTTVNISHQNSCNTYIFTGDGNWDIASNWAANTIPPANLPAGSTIIIDPVITGECILNTTQQIQAGAYLEVKPGKKLTIQGNLITQ
ncbi:MAG: S8 family serine peptidase [Ferruginibacter sp.]